MKASLFVVAILLFHVGQIAAYIYSRNVVDIGRRCAIFDSLELRCFGRTNFDLNASPDLDEYNDNGVLGQTLRRFDPTNDDEVVGDAPNEMGDTLESINYAVGAAGPLLARSFLVSDGIAMTCLAFKMTGPSGIRSSDYLGCYGSVGTGILPGMYEQFKGAGNYVLFDAKNLWGGNLGDDDTLRIKTLSTGIEHACVIFQKNDEDDWFMCWGFNQNGRLGNPKTWQDPEKYAPGNSNTEYTDWEPYFSLLNTYEVPLQRQVKEKYPTYIPVDVQLGAQHTCVLFQDKDNELVKQVACFGDNKFGQVGLDPDEYHQVGGDVSLSDNFNIIKSIQDLELLNFGEENKPKHMCTGLLYTCVSFQNDKLTCFGFSKNGNLGYEDADVDKVKLDPENPRFVNLGLKENETITGLACSELSTHTCVVVNNQKVKCFGLNENGQLGTESTLSRYTKDNGDESLMGENLPFAKLSREENIHKLTISEFGTTCVVYQGSMDMFCWGANEDGEAGAGKKGDIGVAAGEMSALTLIDWGAKQTCGVYNVNDPMFDCPCYSRVDFRVDGTCVPLDNALEAARLRLAQADCLETDMLRSDPYGKVKRAALTTSCTLAAYSMADPQAEDDRAAALSLSALSTLSATLQKYSDSPGIGSQMQQLANDANSFIVRHESQGTVAARENQGSYGFVPPFRPAEYLGSDTFIKSLQFLNERKREIEGQITTLQAAGTVSQDFTQKFGQLFDGLAANAATDKAIADQESSLILEALEELWVRGEGNAKNLERVTSDAVELINDVITKKNDYVEALQKLEEAKAAQAVFDSLVEMTVSMFTLALAAPFTGGASILVGIGKYVKDNLPEIIDVGKTVIEYGKNVNEWADAVNSGLYNEQLASINAQGGSVDIVEASESLSKLLGYIVSVSSDLKIHSISIRNAFAAESAWTPPPENVQITSSPSVWEAIRLEFLNGLAALEVCPVELLVGRRLRAQHALDSDSHSERDVASQLRLRQGTPAAEVQPFGRGLQDKVEEAEEVVEETRKELDKSCVIFLNKFKQVSIYGSAYHANLIESAGLLRRYRAAGFRSEARASQEQDWQNRKNYLLSTVNNKLEDQIEALETELIVNTVAEETEFATVMNTLKDLCASIEYMVPDKNSKTCITYFENANVGLVQDKFSQAINVFSALSLDFRSAAIRDARSGRKVQTIKFDITNLIDFETFKSDGEARVALTPELVNDPELYCARNAEVVHIGIVPIGTSTGTNDGVRSQLTLSSPYIKRVPGDTPDSPVDITFTAAIPDIKYNYDYKFQDECDDGDRVTVCGKRICQSVDVADVSDAFIARPSLFSTVDIFLSKGEAAAAKAKGLYIVAEVLLTYEENCKDQTSTLTCSWDQEADVGLIVGAVVGTLAGVALIAVIVYLGVNNKLHLPSPPKRFGAKASKMASPWESEQAKNNYSQPDLNFYDGNVKPSSFTLPPNTSGFSSKSSASSFGSNFGNNKPPSFGGLNKPPSFGGLSHPPGYTKPLPSPGSWQTQPEFSAKSSWNQQPNYR